MGCLLRSTMTVVLLAAAGVLPAVAEDIAARSSLEMGVRAFEGGSPEAAVEVLSDALDGRLSSRQTAEALYYRGLAYRALGRPGQAISDLTNAMTEKNGLSGVQLAHAADNRAAAYMEAGITVNEMVVPFKPAKRPRVSSARERQPQTFLTTTSIDATEPGISAWAAAAIVPAKLEKVPRVSSAREQQPQTFLTTTSIDSTKPAISAWAATVPAKLEKGPRISSARERQPQSFLTTTSIDSTEPVISTWAAATMVPSITKRASTPFAPAVSPADVQGSAAAGGIRVQVGRVQTPSEAYTLAVRLVSQHGAEFEPGMLKIVPTVTANKDKVYLVRLGPFADADQAQKRCSSLRKSGFDCVVQY